MSWYDVSWTDPDNTGNTFSLFVPKVFLWAVCREWDELSFETIAGLASVPYPMIEAADEFPRKHKFAHCVVHLEDDNITEGNAFLGFADWR